MSKERPILFSAPMVRAILDGRKTMTRRPVKLRGAEVIEERDDTLSSSWPWSPQHDGWVACPYGQAGDRLWARETFCELDLEHFHVPGPRTMLVPAGRYSVSRNGAAYRADQTDPPNEDDEEARRSYGYKWTPSIYMPRWASRITLEVTDVRVERVQEITEKGVYAEGVQIPVTTDGCPPGKGAVLHSISGRFPSIKYARPGADTIDIVRAHFASAWDTIHGADAWTTNPWVCVVSFKRIVP